MLREIQGVPNEPGTHRRWFHDDDFDLFVWQTEIGDVIMFQLCYTVGPDERALVWHQRAGLFHDGPAAGPDKSPASDLDVASFVAAILSLPRKIRRVVGDRIREYAAGRLPATARRRRVRREVWQERPSA